MGKTKLYSLSQTGRIPVSKIGKKWVYEQLSLDEWLRASKSLESYFMNTAANIENNANLREPQRDGYLRAYDYFSSGGQKAVIQLPVGCGKSGLASILPFGIAKGRALIITPNLTIKDELQKTLDISNRQKCFWRRMQVLEDADMIAGPYVCTLETGNISVCEQSHIILTNIQQLATNTDKWLNQFSADFFDLIIVDEAHHGAASSWKKVFSKFPVAKVINLTATPFRSDRQELEGDLIYRYPFKSASIKGYIKKLKATYVAPTELTFTVDGNKRTFTLDEVLAMKEEEWFSRGVALSDPCNVNIVDNSLEKLEQLRLSGTRHQIIAVACSINHGQRIRSLYEERGYRAEIIHSKLDYDKQETIIRDLRNGTLDCIVQVQMLGEGFDHPKLSVAAIFRPFRSLAPYIQFVGRILRVVVQNDPTHPDNYGYIITHVGMNLDEQLKRFKQFENDDQAFWEEVTGSGEPEPPRDVLTGKTRMKLREDMVVNREIVDRVFEEEFTTAEDADIVADLEQKLEQLGLDPSLAKEVVTKSALATPQSSQAKAAQPFAVLPMKQWQEGKKRLNEEAKRTANLLLNRFGLVQAGVEIPRKLKPSIGANNNFVAGLQMVNE
ncbi:MAG: DEAD/DEAH box helicase family protein, partial [Nitrospirae bacterium]|nr:DEAD/DEAH box helicase family protein [Nitrospirota bacterium]